VIRASVSLGRWVRRLLLAGFGLVVVLFATIGLLYFTRGTPPSVVHAFGDPTGPPVPGTASFARTIEVLTSTTLDPGAAVEPVLDGAIFSRLWRDLRSARRSINVQIYYANPGVVTDTLKSVLLERAAAGVPVRLLYDAFGAGPLTRGWLDSLSAGGVRVTAFRPVRWYALHKAQNRSHVRAVVVDGAIGYTGGFGVDDRWRGSGERPDEWRDTNVRFAGPAVAQLQAAFASAWTEATGELLVGPLFFPREETQSHLVLQGSAHTVLAGLMYSAPALGSTAAGRLIAVTLAGARERIWIANAYAVPGPELRLHLAHAAARGVDVRLLVPGERTDVPIARYAARATYASLLRNGVRIFEYQPSMMHAKTLVADGVWSIIGSMNLDNRSLALNEEAVLLVQDARLGAFMDSLFLADLSRSEEIRLEAFLARGWLARTRDAIAGMWTSLL